jgi:D-alanine-D-alanine ligase
VRVVLENDPDPRAEDIDWGFGDVVLIETYVPGREVHVAVMGDRALGAVEIRPKGRFYDYKAKYTAGGADHVMPAPLPAPVYAEALRIALGAHRALGCRGVSRADLRYDDTKVTGDAMGRFALLEVNTQPGMTPLSLVPEIAAHVGISFQDLVLWMVENARCDA